MPRGNGSPDFNGGFASHGPSAQPDGHRPAFWRNEANGHHPVSWRNEANGHHPGVLAERSQRASPRCLGGTKPTGAARSIGGTKPTGPNRCIDRTNPPTIYCPWVPALRAQPPDQVRIKSGGALGRDTSVCAGRGVDHFRPNEANARNVDAFNDPSRGSIRNASSPVLKFRRPLPDERAAIPSF